MSALPLHQPSIEPDETVDQAHEREDRARDLVAMLRECEADGVHTLEIRRAA